MRHVSLASLLIVLANSANAYITLDAPDDKLTPVSDFFNGGDFVAYSGSVWAFDVSSGTTFNFESFVINEGAVINLVSQEPVNIVASEIVIDGVFNLDFPMPPVRDQYAGIVHYGNITGNGNLSLSSLALSSFVLTSYDDFVPLGYISVSLDFYASEIPEVESYNIQIVSRVNEPDSLPLALAGMVGLALFNCKKIRKLA